jgi:hypothetical protein
MNAWRPHLACLALMGLMGLFAGVSHRSAAELRLAAASGPADERIQALHALLNRAEAAPGPEHDALVAELLASSEPLLREYALSIDLCRLSARDAQGVPIAQEAAVLGMAQPPCDGPWWLEYVAYRRKVGGKQVGGRRRLDLIELDWYRRALRGEALPKDEVFRYLVERVRDAHAGPIPRGQ